MKKIVGVTVFLFSVGLIFSQNRADTTIYVEPISGGTRAEQSFFDENLKMEVAAAGYTLIDEMVDATYSVGGSIAPEDDGNVLSITLSNVEQGRELVAQELFYVSVEESYEVLPFLIWQMLANAPFIVIDVPPTPPPAPVSISSSSSGDTSNNSGKIATIVNLVNAVPDDDSWKHKWIYTGIRLGLSPRMYQFAETNSSWDFKPEVDLELGLHFLDFLTLQVEVNFNMENVPFMAPSDPAQPTVLSSYSFDPGLIAFPVLLKGVLKPGLNFIIELYGGAYFISPIIIIKPPELDSVLSRIGWIAGFDFGVKSGSGIIFFDFRFSMDLEDTKVVNSLGSGVEYKRIVAAIVAGYKIGFMNRKQGISHFRGARY
jgi:hypothetical protein